MGAEAEKVIRDLGADPDDFDWERIEQLRYQPEEAERLITAAQRRDRPVIIRLGGVITDDLIIDQRITGDLLITGAIEGDLYLLGEVAGKVVLTDAASVEGDVRVLGDVGDMVRVEHTARIAGGLWVMNEARLGHVFVVDEARIDRGIFIVGGVRLRGLVLEGAARTTVIRIDSGATVRDLEIVGRVQAGGLLIHDATVRDVIVRNGATLARVIISSGEIRSVEVTGDGRIAESFEIGAPATLSGRLLLAGRPIRDHIEIGGKITGAVTLDTPSTTVRLTGDFQGPVRLTPRRDSTDRTVSRLDSLVGARFVASVHLGAGVSITSCDLRQCGDLDELELGGADLLLGPDGSPVAALANPPAGSDECIPDGEMASIYRQLRVNLEGKGNRPASAFFYRGEMDSRRRAARQQRRWSEWAWISLYRMVAGYGLRVAPPLLWFAALVGLGGVAFHSMDLGQSWPSTFVFTAHSMLSLFRPPDIGDDWAIGALQIVLRVLGPVLLGLAALAVRDKVAR